MNRFKKNTTAFCEKQYSVGRKKEACRAYLSSDIDNSLFVLEQCIFWDILFSTMNLEDKQYILSTFR